MVFFARMCRVYWFYSFVALLCCVIVQAAHATDKSSEIAIRFKKGESSAVLEGGIIRGEQVHYTLSVKADQYMNINVISPEDNAVFHIYLPNRKDTLAGVGEHDNASVWSGTLPTSGEYLIVLGSRRGNTAYTLSVEVEPAIDCNNANTQVDMNQCAARAATTVEQKLGRLMTLLAAQMPAEKWQKLNGLNKKWLDLRNVECQFEADFYAEGGSMNPMLVSSCVENQTKERIERLKAYLCGVEADNCEAARKFK